MRPLADGLLALLLAPRCAACQKVLAHPLDGAVCPACWNAVPLITPPTCRLCGDPLPSWRIATLGAGTCPRCRRSVGFIDRGGAAGQYDGALRSIIHALKYDGRRSIGRPLARLLQAQCADVLADADGVVPVPLHPRRLRRRGFNQAAEIARHLGLPFLPVLRRQRDTEPQMALPAARRHRNVREAFAITRRARHREAVRGRRLVLVDDVSTTGATVQECARVLKQAGALEVRAVTVARVVRSRP